MMYGKITVILTALISFQPLAADMEGYDCSLPGRSIELELQNAVMQNLSLNLKEIPENKIKTKILFSEPVNDALISQLAKESYNAAGSKEGSPDSYKAIFSGNHMRNLVVEITYNNKENKRAIFIASGLIDDNECSVRFNGYITVKREF